MKPIESFTLDHTTLIPGIYERYTKDGVKTWDIRFKKPNSGDYLKPEVSHSLEHLLATYLKNVFKDNAIYGVFPMGCLTGFYVLTKEYVSFNTMVMSMLGASAYIETVEEVPGASFESCGNYKFQDLDGAKAEIHKFYDEVLSNYEKTLCEELCNEEPLTGDCINSIGD